MRSTPSPVQEVGEGSGRVRDSPGIRGVRLGRRCRRTLPHGGAVEGPSASTKRLLSASPCSRSGSPGAGDPIPSAVTSARGDPHLSSRGCSSAEFGLQCFFTAAVQVPAGPWSPRAAQAAENPNEPLFSTQNTKRAVSPPLSGQQATGILLLRKLPWVTRQGSPGRPISSLLLPSTSAQQPMKTTLVFCLSLQVKKKLALFSRNQGTTV